MKHITVTIDDETYDRAAAMAAERDMSISDMVQNYLAGKPPFWNNPVSPEEFQRLAEMELELRSRIRNFNGSDRLSRDEVHDRKRRE